MKTIEGYDVKIFTDRIDDSAVEQIRRLLSVDVFADKKLRIMPDVHAGAGCVIGFTGDLGDKVIPNIVGVDIGCGMRVLRLGKQVAKHYQDRAVKYLSTGIDESEIEQLIRDTIEEYKAAGRSSEIQHAIKKLRHKRNKAASSLPSDLCYVEGKGREEYLHDMRLCQQWAIINRHLIAMLLMRFFPGVEPTEVFESVHNYISDDNIIRKGAISAASGERCIIPLNMRDGSLICTGKGNPDWNCSAPHGAGRVLSRSQAYERITMDDFRESMQGIYSESVTGSTRDESPMV